MNEVGRPVLIVAGGTGGHIYPALAVADYLKNRNVTTVWLGSRRGMETRIVPAAGIRLFRIAVSGLRGHGLWRWLIAPFVLSIALVHALVTVIRVRPILVLGMGGFASGPGGLAAWICGRPLVIHEQNAIAGLTNSILSRVATKVLEGFPDSFPARCRAITVGNPVRDSITSIAPPRARGTGLDTLRILVVGGSRGARALNDGVPRAIGGIDPQMLEIRHQAGAGNEAATREAYAHTPVTVRVTEFIDDMAAAYDWADLVICRAGAITVSELAAVGVASILVPFPHAVDDHQTANADYLVRANAAILVAEGPEFVRRLAAAVQHLHRSPGQILQLARRARELAKPQATTLLADHCLELMDA